VIPDSAIRLMGADPAVYRPVARAQRLILRRRNMLGRSSSGMLRGITPEQFRYFATAAFSVYLLGLVLGTPSKITVVAFTLTTGAAFLLVDLIADKFAILADPDEYQVIAAHPHDAWSVVLAKIVVVGRSIAILAACAYTLPAVATGIAFHSVATGLAYAVAAAALTITVSAGGMLATAALVALGGRSALHRLLPLFHAVYALLYAGILLGRGAFIRVEASTIDALGLWKWFPTLWFTGPVEWATGKAGATTLVRAALAVGSFLVLLPLSARWIRTRFDECILEPVTRRTRVKVRERAASRTWRPQWSIGPRVFLSLLFAHLRSDVAVRGGFMAAFIMPVVMLVSSQTSRSAVKEWPQYTVTMVGIGLGYAAMLLAQVLQTSSRPAALWFVLIAPNGRRAFSSAMTWVIRIGLLVPAMIGLAIYVARYDRWPMEVRALYVVLVAILCDAVLVAARGFSPAIPFSLPVRAGQRFRWGTIALLIAVPALLGVFSFVFTLLANMGVVACLFPIVFAVVLRVLGGFWANWRIGNAVQGAEAV
jgi:hypothetical protein